PEREGQAVWLDGGAGAREPATDTELGQDRGRADRTNAVEVGDQGTAAALAAGERAQRPVERDKFAVDRLQHPERERDQLAPGRGELHLGERLPTSAGARLQPARDSLMEKLCL